MKTPPRHSTSFTTRFATAWLLTLLMNSAVAVADTEQQVYTFGVVPQFEARRLADIWVPLLQELGQRTGLKFRMVGAPRIPEFEQAFTAGDFDFAYMNPYHCMLAFQSQGYAPLVRDGQRKLYGILVVRSDSPIRSVEELDGARIAFPAPNALGASLLMRSDLARHYDLDYQPVYAQTHTSSYLNVLLGETDAAGGVQSTLDGQSEQYRNNLRIIYETQRLPAHPIVVHPRVSTDVADRVKEALLELASTPRGRELLKKVPMGQPISTSVEDYRQIEELGLDKFFVPMSDKLHTANR